MQLVKIQNRKKKNQTEKNRERSLPGRGLLSRPSKPAHQGPDQLTVSIRRRQAGPSDQKKKSSSSSSLLLQGRHAAGDSTLTPSLWPPRRYLLIATESISSPSSTSKVINEIRARNKHDCLRRIPTVADKEMTITTSSRPIKSLGAPWWNPRSPTPSQSLSNPLCSSPSTGGVCRSSSSSRRLRPPRSPWDGWGGLPRLLQHLKGAMHPGELWAAWIKRFPFTGYHRISHNWVQLRSPPSSSSVSSAPRWPCASLGGLLAPFGHL
jgi:hypothetical protein